MNANKHNDSEALNKIDNLTDEQKYNLLCELLRTKPAYYMDLIEYLLLSINDNSFLLVSLSVASHFIPPMTIIKVFKKIDNDLDRIEGINRYFTDDTRMPILKYVLLTFDSDINKQAFFNLLNNEEKVLVIKSFKSDNEKMKYIDNRKYREYKPDIIASLNSKQMIANYFNNSDDIKFNLELIKKINDPKLKKLFINALGFEDLNKFWDEIHNTEDNEPISYDKDNIDSSISIGVELEVCHKYIQLFKLCDNIFEDYTIDEEESLDNGFEIKSPVLHYTNEDLSKLKKVCDVLNHSHFYTDKNCGGHIHIGADYLNNIENYKTLLYIYCNCENIFYLISNKANTKLRKKSKYFANKVKSLYIKSLNKGILNKEECSFEDFLKLLVQTNGKRDKGMNFKNLGDVYKNTIEFRMPNGEIDFEELRNNIKLFAKLIEKSKELSSDKVSDKDKTLLTALNIPCTDDEKLGILLGLLFDNEEDKNIYRERYHSNKSTKQRVMSKYYKDKKTLNFK